MGYVKEPEGIDFFINSKMLSEKDKKEISEIIAYYKATGKKKKSKSSRALKSKKNTSTASEK